MKSAFNPFRPSGTDKVARIQVRHLTPALHLAHRHRAFPISRLLLVPANANVLRLLEAQDTPSDTQRQTLNGTDALVLTYEVTYWDYVGWPDSFGDARWDARQREYAAAMGSRKVYTLQGIVNGTSNGVGARQNELNALIREGASAPHANSVSVTFSTSPPPPSPSTTTKVTGSGPLTHPPSCASSSTTPRRTVSPSRAARTRGASCRTATSCATRSCSARGWAVLRVLRCRRASPRRGRMGGRRSCLCSVEGVSRLLLLRGLSGDVLAYDAVRNVAA
ncbi:hypothetical protein PsYK624_065850 [Phanerochaete sordida]|uniref:Uncharacterized protein n=1 Tax=Phanerochaete sordida TaxID=48140 RepID=A0A9P3GAN7_9APHY|nr:hypothetical protein PsYK624_065850 [Phanerochaete sordida]